MVEITELEESCMSFHKVHRNAENDGIMRKMPPFRCRTRTDLLTPFEAKMTDK